MDDRNTKRWCRRALLAAALTLAARPAAAQEAREPVAILELGGAVETGLNHRETSYGPSLSAEVTPVERWLEIEAGVAPLFGHGRTEWGFDLLFKKPWTLSRTVELMAGVGPSWSHTVDGGHAEDSVAVEAALDVMVWPGRDRRLGWFVEPSFGRALSAGHDRSLSVSAGLLVPIGRR